MPGPPPKPDGEKRRRNAPMANTLQLPAEGRQGPAPVWPGPGLMPEPYRAIWEDLWSTPMAVAWERNNWTRVIARYLLVLQASDDALKAKEPNAKLLIELRNLEDRLGMTPMSLMRLRWEITGDELAPAREAKASGGSRARLRAVNDGK